MKPAGELIYATCSVLMQENEQVIDAFLHSEEGRLFSLASFSESPAFCKESAVVAYLQAREDGRGQFQSIPLVQSDFDGHFCARLIRREG